MSCGKLSLKTLAPSTQAFSFLLKHVFTLNGKFDFTFLVLYSLNLPGECLTGVTGKGCLLMAKKGRRFEVCCREGKVLLKREHWHQSIIENWIRLSFKNLLVTQFPQPFPMTLCSHPPPSKIAPESQQKMPTENNQSSMTTPQNNKQHIFKSEEPDLS